MNEGHKIQSQVNKIISEAYSENCLGGLMLFSPKN